jgi:hypothetical protein
MYLSNLFLKKVKIKVRDIKHLFYIIFCDFNFCSPELTAEYRRNYRYKNYQLYGIFKVDNNLTTTIIHFILHVFRIDNRSNRIKK